MNYEIEQSAGGLAVVYRSLRDLVPYARNARIHSAEQIALIRRSMAHYGWTNPMLIAGNDMIAGHARLRAALEMANEGQTIPNQPDPWVGPTIDLSHLPPADRAAYVITDNQSALLAGWDKDLLRLDMSDLRAGGFDLSLTGFGGLEIDMLLTGQSTNVQAQMEGVDRPLTDAEKLVWDEAWKRLMTDWHYQVAGVRDGGLLSTSYTKGSLAVAFTRCLLYGGEIQRGYTYAYQPHRLFVNAHQHPLSDVFLAARDNPLLLESVRWQARFRPLYDSILSASLGIHGYRAPNDFPAHLARDLIDEFCPDPDARILDPCHGWGGRMLGFLLSRQGGTYHGFDVSPQTQDGVQAMFDDLAPLCLQQKAARLDLIPYQEASLDADAYDFAFTSPPYFNIEKYDGERQSWREFKNFDDWVAGFYRPMINITAKALKPGACFALQVGSQMFPLARLAKDLGTRAGMDIMAVRPTDMTNQQMKTEAHDGEVIVVLRKQDGHPLPKGTLRYVSPPLPPGYLDHLDGVYVRKLTSGDEVRRALRVRQAYAGKELRPMPAVVYHTAADEGRMWGAFDAASHEIIGYATVRWRRRDNTCEFQQIGVNEDAPKGTGRLLTTARWNYAVDRGATACTLNTLLTSTRARMYHERYGFIEDHRDDKNIYYRMSLSPVAQ